MSSRLRGQDRQGALRPNEPRPAARQVSRPAVERRQKRAPAMSSRDLEADDGTEPARAVNPPSRLPDPDEVALRRQGLLHELRSPEARNVEESATRWL